MFTLRNFSIGIAIVLVIGGGLFLLLRRQQNSPLVATEQSLQNTQPASSTGMSIPGVNVTANGNAEIRDVTGHSKSPISAPDYRAPLTFSASTSADVEAALNAQFTMIKSILAKDPANFGAWIDLGIVRKTGGDYQGAAADWTYVTKIYSTNSVAFDDLGDLYANFLHDPAQARVDYAMALKLSPNDWVAKQGLAGLK